MTRRYASKFASSEPSFLWFSSWFSLRLEKGEMPMESPTDKDQKWNEAVPTNPGSPLLFDPSRILMRIWPISNRLQDHGKMMLEMGNLKDLAQIIKKGRKLSINDYEGLSAFKGSNASRTEKGNNPK
ncbi:hypothetical protein AMTR_s00096p00152690 [Amborella trichopoda]|uniref:Uncharacterized protein n=1 Tax=Amborella trichopoda TaxID=13333 RepID=W1P447_AMBTC|nr:hypothetical protein AMTR_s00096p00152690 [Amborella trichopoda]